MDLDTARIRENEEYESLHFWVKNPPENDLYEVLIQEVIELDESYEGPLNGISFPDDGEYHNVVVIRDTEQDKFTIYLDQEEQ